MSGDELLKQLLFSCKLRKIKEGVSENEKGEKRETLLKLV